MDYLVFRLYGPMASWGEIAVGEARHSASYPSKSAVCGLLAAALGIDRSEDATHQAIAEGYQQAVKMVSSGSLLRDYHTAQAPDAAGKFRYRTRRDELIHGKDRLGTILSNREYRADSQAIVALRTNKIAPYTLLQIQQALLTPVFHLYLGRKSCPLSAPLDPQMVDTNNFKSALDNYLSRPLLFSDSSWDSETRWLKQDPLVRYYWEGVPEDFALMEDEDFNPNHLHKLIRHDKPLSRQRWQFQSRTEYLWLGQQKDTR